MTTAERTDAPGRVIPILEQEFDDFATEAHRVPRRPARGAQFIGFRLKQGVYGQRQPARQMIRVKLPFGGVTADQLDAFAIVAEDYAPLRKGHVTTRQNYPVPPHPARPDGRGAGTPRQGRSLQP